MAVKVANPNKAKPRTYPFLQMLLFLGPILMLEGLHSGIDDALRRTNEPSRQAEWFSYGLALAGMSMLVYGLTLLKARQDHLEERLDELESLKN